MKTSTFPLPRFSPEPGAHSKVNAARGFFAAALILFAVHGRANAQGFSQPTGHAPGTLLASWPLAFNGAGGRTTSIGYHRGYLFTDTRYSRFQVWDISNLAAPREVHSLDAGAPNHHFFLVGDHYLNNGGSEFATVWDLSNMLNIRPGSLPYQVRRDSARRDWFTLPFVYTGQNAYHPPQRFCRIFDSRTDTLLASIDFESSVGFAGIPLVIGNLMLVGALHDEGVAAFDVSDPRDPVLLDVLSASGSAYEPAIYRNYIAMPSTTQSGTDHLNFIDFSDPTNLRLALSIPNIPGNNRYVQFQDRAAFLGERKYDLSNFPSFTEAASFSGSGGAGEIGEYLLPLGNVVVGSHWGGGNARIYVHQIAPDTRGPEVAYVNPRDGATFQRVTSRIGVVINETLDAATVNAATFFVRPVGGSALPGTVSLTDKDVLTFVPDQNLQADREYEIIFTANGVRDVAGNAILDTTGPGDSLAFRSRFYTGAATIGGPPAISVFSHNATLARQTGTSVTFTLNANHSATMEYNIRFGDGTETGWTGFGGSATRSHTFQTPGNFLPVALVRETGRPDNSAAETTSLVIHEALTPTRPTAATSIAVDQAAGRVWVVNPDNASVQRINAQTDALEGGPITVGAHPASVAVDNQGRAWVACRDSDQVWVINANGTPSSGGPIALSYGSRPVSILLNPAATQAFVVEEGPGRITRLDTATLAVSGQRTVFGPSGRTTKPRAAAITADGSKLIVAQFTSEGVGTGAAGRMWILNLSTLTVERALSLPVDTASDDTSIGARGVPNYVRGLAVLPQGNLAWYAAKKDNVVAGRFRDGNDLTFETSIRALTGVIDLNGTAIERVADRKDIDNHGPVAAIAFNRVGTQAIAVMQSNNRIVVLDIYTKQVLDEVDVGLAPEGVALFEMANGQRKIFVHNFMSRDVTIFEASALLERGQRNTLRSASVKTVRTFPPAAEKLSPIVLRGKQLFYTARDIDPGQQDNNPSKITQDGYFSCAACHLDGGHDGRVWDFTNRGEGLRNTISLRGRGGMDHGNVHWTANFDEIQDFELDIVNHFNGRGFIGNPHPPLGTNNRGRNADLDALAAYVASLAGHTLERSPHRQANGSLTASAATGRDLFLGNVQTASGRTLNCATCHNPARGYTESPAGVVTLRNVGTLKPGSGQRLGGSLSGIDTPTLLGIHAAGPYLHDGSAPTLRAVFDQFNTGGGHDLSATGFNLNETERNNLVNFLLSLDGSDALAPDLVVADITWSPANPSPGAAVTFTAEVRNQGTLPTPPGTVIGVGISVNGAQVTWGIDDASGLAVGASRTITANGPATFTWTASAGSHAIQAHVDDVGRIAESNESNNTRDESLAVASPGGQPDLTVEDIVWSPATPTPGQTVTFSATIRNRGSADVPAGTLVTFPIFIDGTYLTWGGDDSGLAAGTTRTFLANRGSVSSWTTTPGDHAVRAVVDDLNRVAESDEGNNIRTETLSTLSWTGQDIGAVGQTGTFAQSAATFTVEGSGADIWGAADAFHFATVSGGLPGDGEIIARIATQENTNPWAKAGVMIREGLAANAKFAMSALTPLNGTAFQRRTATGVNAQHTAGAAASAPRWVRLVRTGDTFTAYQSADGSSWTAIGAPVAIPMVGTVQIGLCVTAHDNATLCTTLFDGVQVVR